MSSSSSSSNNNNAISKNTSNISINTNCPIMNDDYHLFLSTIEDKTAVDIINKKDGRAALNLVKDMETKRQFNFLYCQLLLVAITYGNMDIRTNALNSLQQIMLFGNNFNEDLIPSFLSMLYRSFLNLDENHRESCGAQSSDDENDNDFIEDEFEIKH